MAPIAIGEKIPEGSLAYMDSEKGRAASGVRLLSGSREKGHSLWSSRSLHNYLQAWEKNYPESKNVKFLADGSATYTYALGLELDLSDKGLGIRSRRFALLVDDLQVKLANIEEGEAFIVSSAKEILKAI